MRPAPPGPHITALVWLKRDLRLADHAPLAEAARRCSTIAARHLGLADRGQLCPGAWADVVVLDQQFRVEQVWVEGERIAPDAGRVP